MYRVTVRDGWNGKEQTLHSENLNSARLLAAKITKDVDSIDSFEFRISPTSPHYNDFKYRTTFVKVTDVKDGKVLFEGRVSPTTDAMDSSGFFDKTVVCEGLLSFLSDSVQDYLALSNNDLRAFLARMIEVHNSQVEWYKQIKLGIVTVVSPSDNVYKSIDDSKTTYETIQEKLIDKYGGELRLRHEDDGLYLDYMPEVAALGSQNIQLASNLLSLKKVIDPSEAYSVLKPLGAKDDTPSDEQEGQDENDAEISKPRLTIGAVNYGSPFLYSNSMIDKIGYVVRAEIWENVKTPAILKSKGQAMLDSQKSIKEQFQVTAVDLNMVSDNYSVSSFECGNYHRTINPLQGIDELLRIVGQTIDLCNPLNSSLSIGDKIIGQDDYELVISRQNDALRNIRDKVTEQKSQLTASNEKVTEATEQLKVLKQSYEDLIGNIGDTDVKAILEKLKSIDKQTETALSSIKTINATVGELESFKNEQTIINGAQAKTNSDFKQRIEVLEGGEKSE